jgi:hypothetical protein
MPDTDYKRFLNFLGTHACVVDFREFRTPATHDDGAVVKEQVLPEASPPRGGRASHPP